MIGVDSPVQYDPDEEVGGAAQADAGPPGAGGRELIRACRHQHRSTTSARRASTARSPRSSAHDGDARIIAGGHSLLPMMKLRLAQPERLIDINDLDELSYITEPADEIRIGALTRHVELLHSELLARHFPLFADAEEVIADPVVRNRGTIGGSLCQADAAEDLSAVCSAVKAQVVIRGADGERVVGDGRVPHRPVHDRRRRRRAAHRGPDPAQAGRRHGPREDRAPRRRLGDRGRVGGGLDRRRHDHRRRDRAVAPSARRPSTSPAPRSCCAARRRPRSCSRRPGRSPPRTARPRPTAAARSTTSAISPAS